MSQLLPDELWNRILLRGVSSDAASDDSRPSDLHQTDSVLREGAVTSVGSHRFLCCAALVCRQLRRVSGQQHLWHAAFRGVWNEEEEVAAAKRSQAAQSLCSTDSNGEDQHAFHRNPLERDPVDLDWRSLYMKW